MRKINARHIAVGLTLLALVPTLLVLWETLPRTLALILPMLLVIGGSNALRANPLHPSEKALGLLIIAGAALLLTDLQVENFWRQTVTFLWLVIMAKLLSPFRPKDLLQIHLLNLLALLAAAALHGPQILGLFVTEGLLVLTGLLFLYLARERLHLTVGEASLMGAYGLLLAGAAIGLSLLLTTILPWPRLSRWNIIPWDPWIAALPLDKLSLNDTPAFRVIWQQGPRPAVPYWRVLTYDTYSQGKWLKLYRQPLSYTARPEKGATYVYEIRPSAPLKALPLLGEPVDISPREELHLVSGDNWIGQGFLLKRYRVRARVRRSLPPDLPPEKYLQVPPEIRTRLLPLVNKLKRSTPRATVLAVKDYLKRHYQYSLDPGHPTRDPVLYFLFRSKRGHCQYWASAMALLLRTAGIPTRIVAGYLGGTWVKTGHYYLVRQREAHFWVEAWLGQGWIPLDPTPAAVLPPEDLSSQILARLDYLFFLGEDLSLALKERRILSFLRQGLSQHWYSLVVFAILFSLVLSGGLFWKRFLRKSSPLEEFLALLKAEGLERRHGETLAELTRRATERWPTLRADFEAFLEAYHETTYGAKDHHERLKQLVHLIRHRLWDLKN